jgi:predicted DsbA family dithiol-disulfide isomerase
LAAGKQEPTRDQARATDITAILEFDCHLFCALRSPGIHHLVKIMHTSDLTTANDQHDNLRTVLHWYDFLCPFCYVGQQRTTILVYHRLDVVELPFQAHPDIPPGGIPAGPRNGPMYVMLEREAREAGLPLHWPPRLPNTRRALAAAEWTRRHQPRAFPRLRKDLFEAHFALGEDLEDPAVIDQHARASGIDLAALHVALADGSAVAAVTEAEMIGRKSGVKGTPAWLLGRRLIEGLLPAAEFELLAEYATQLPR